MDKIMVGVRMPILLRDQLKRIADTNRRSTSQQVLVMLEKAVEAEKERANV